eukprot:3419396-Rhodomonas_salina.1
MKHPASDLLPLQWLNKVIANCDSKPPVPSFTQAKEKVFLEDHTLLCNTALATRLAGLTASPDQQAPP